MNGEDASSSKKRKLSSTPMDITSPSNETGDEELHQLTNHLISSLTALTSLSNVLTAAQFHQVFSPLSAAINLSHGLLQSKIDSTADQAQTSSEEKGIDRFGKWNWIVSETEIARLTGLDLSAWNMMRSSKEGLEEAGIYVHPAPGVFGEWDMSRWLVHIPGPPNTPWEGGVYSAVANFRKEPSKSCPLIKFIRPLFHPNIYPSGTWDGFHANVQSVADFNEGEWCSTLPPNQLMLRFLLCLQDSLNHPYPSDPAQRDAYSVIKNSKEDYKLRVEEQAKQWTPTLEKGLAGRPILQD